MTANSLIDLALEEITRDYHPGALVWMKMNRSEEWGKVLAIEGKVNKLALGSNLKGLREALSEYQGLILAMVKEFKALKEKKARKFLILWSSQVPLGRVRGG